MKKLIPLFFLFQFSFFLSKAQLPNCDSPNQQLLSLNPAFAGTNKYLRIQGIGSGCVSDKNNTINFYGYAGCDGLIDKKHHGLALSYFYGNYNFKTLQEQKIDLTYAFHFTIKQKLRIVTAIQGSFFKLKLDRNKLNFGDVIDPRRYFIWNTNEIIPAQSKYNADISTGLLGYGRNYFLGIGVFSLNRPDEGLLGVSKRPITYIFQGGYRFSIGPNKNIDPYAILKMAGDNGTEEFLQYGTNIHIKMITLHVAHRMNKFSDFDGVIAGLNFNAMGFKIGANALYMYSNSKGYYIFSEVYLSMNFGYRREKKAEEAGTNSPGPVRLFF